MDRLLPAELAQLREGLAAVGLPLAEGEKADAGLAELRGFYEPYVFALARVFLVTLPPWLPPAGSRDNWQTTAYGDDLSHSD